MSPPGVPLASGWVRHGRARLNLAMRLATRAYQVLSIGGAGRGPVRGTLAAASAASDVALARRLARSDRPDLLRHWLVDAADLAVWTAAGDRPGPAQPSAALTPGHPLAIEAGARHGGYGLVVPVVNAAVMSAVQRLRGRPSVPGVVAWQVAAAVGGAGLARYARGLRARRLLGRETRLAAELSRTELAAQNDLALRLDNVVDEVQRAAVLLHLGGAADGAGPAGPWKADLAERTRRSHRYLVDALLAWQRRHNDTPRLADVVELVPAPDLAPVVLTAEAACRLAAALDAQSLRGRVPVALGSAAEEGSRVVLAVGPHLVELDTGVTPVRMAFDPVPGGFAWMALWLAVALPQCAVPPAAALGPATGALGLMAWAHRTGRGATAGSRDALILASTALAVGSAAVQTRTMRAPHDDLGIPPMAVGLGLRGHALVTALARPGLSTPALAVAWLGGRRLPAWRGP